MCGFVTSIFGRPRLFLRLQHTPITKPIYTQNSEEPEKVMIPFYATPTVYGVSEDVVNLGAVQFETTDWTIVGHKK